MLVLPWYLRFAFDFALVATPFVYLNCTCITIQITQLLTSSSTSKINVALIVEEVYIKRFRPLNSRETLRSKRKCCRDSVTSCRILQWPGNEVSLIITNIQYYLQYYIIE